MKLYMLDTNILIYAIKHPLSSVVDRIVDLAVQGKLCISAVTYGELEVGILKSAWQEFLLWLTISWPPVGMRS